MNDWLARLQDRFKSIEEIGKTFVVLGVVLYGGGDAIQVGFLRQFGMAVFGAGIGALGASTFQFGEASMFQRDLSMSQRIQELIARLWGVGFVVLGVTLFGYGILTALNARTPIPSRIGQFFDTPQGTALLVMGGGLLGIVYALSIIFVNDVHRGNSVVRVMLSVPQRLFGVFLLLVFCTVAIVSALELLHPGTWQTLVQLVLERIGLD